MGNLMIKCPRTGEEIYTGMTAERTSFAVTPVFFGVAFCAACGGTHDWFARDAWVQDASSASRAHVFGRSGASPASSIPPLRAVRKK